LTTALEQTGPSAQTIERVLVEGDLSKLSTDQRLAYYRSVCDSLGLNPLTKPFAYLNLNGKLQLYALRDATDQLRRLHRVSVEIIERQLMDDLYVVRARAMLPDGRADESLGAVNINNLRGEAKANALMKGETKAKRRVTLSICGLGWLDETEADTIPNAVAKDGLVRTEDQLAAVSASEDIPVNTDTGEILEPEPAPGLYVLKIDDSKKGSNRNGPWTLYKVTFNDGRTLSTFNTATANAASEALAGGKPVEIEVDGRDLVKVSIVGGLGAIQHPPVEHELQDSDIPF